MSEFLINGNPQNVPKLKGGDVMFYVATKEQIEQLHLLMLMLLLCLEQHH